MVVVPLPLALPPLVVTVVLVALSMLFWPLKSGAPGYTKQCRFCGMESVRKVGSTYLKPEFARVHAQPRSLSLHSSILEETEDEHDSYLLWIVNRSRH